MNKPKIVFLDRDGVINLFKPGGYVNHLSEFRFLPRVKEALRLLTVNKYEIHVVSNQQGVSKGHTPPQELEKITHYMLKEIEKAGGKIQSVNYCIHLNEAHCRCRKPKPGLLKHAVQGRKIDFSKTWLVGDSSKDILAGKTLGCKTIWIRKPVEKKILKDKQGNYWDGTTEFHPDYVVRTLYQSVQIILGSDSSNRLSNAKT